MTSIRIGCVPITYGQFRRQNPDAWTEERVLGEIAQAGYEGVSSGPRENKTAEVVTALLARFGLKPAPGYLAGVFWEPAAQDEIVEHAKRHAAFTRATGLTELFVAPQGSDYRTRSGKTRNQIAGHVRPEDSLTDDEYQRMADCLNRVGQATLAEGVRSCFHNHVGLAVETRDEVDRLMALTDPDALFLGPDTGHLAWAGADPVAFCRDYAPRIKAMHLKDIHEPIRAQGAAEAWEYGAFVQAGLFAELGEGCVDFPAILAILKEAGFAGWLLAETDWTTKPTALESITASRAYLRSLGL